MLRSFDNARAAPRLADDRRRAGPSTDHADDPRAASGIGPIDHVVDTLLELQRTAGNRRVQQAVARLRPSLIQPKLAVGARRIAWRARSAPMATTCPFFRPCTG